MPERTSRFEDSPGLCGGDEDYPADDWVGWETFVCWQLDGGAKRDDVKGLEVEATCAAHAAKRYAAESLGPKSGTHQYAIVVREPDGTERLFDVEMGLRPLFSVIERKADS